MKIINPILKTKKQTFQEVVLMALSALQADISGIKEAFSDTETRLGSIETRLGSIETRLGSIEIETSETKDNLDTLSMMTKNQFDIQNQKIHTLIISTNEIKKDLEYLQKEDFNKDSALEDIQSNIKSNYQTLNSKITILENK